MTTDPVPGSGDRISELFSQALGEQVAEERKIQQVLTDVRSSVSRIEELTGDSLRDTVRTSVQATAGAAVDGAIARTVGPSLAELRTALDALDRRIDELAARLDQHSDALSALPTGVEIDAVGTSLASLRSAALTREDVADAVRSSSPAPVEAPELDITAIGDMVEAAVTEHGSALTRDLRGAISESADSLRAHLDGQLDDHRRAIDEQLAQRSSALSEAIAGLAPPPAPETLSADEVRGIVTEVVSAATVGLVPEPGPAPLSADEVHQIVTSATAGLKVEPGPAPLSADEVHQIVTSATAGLKVEPGPAPLSADEVHQIVTSATAGLKVEPGPAPLGADEVHGIVTDAVALATTGLVPEPGPTPLSADEVRSIITEVLAVRRAEIPAQQRPPSAAEVAAEISGGLAGLRADLGEELAELVEDQLGELPTRASITALGDQLAAVHADVETLRAVVPPTPEPLDLQAISAAVVSALPPAPVPERPEPVDVGAISSAVVAALPPAPTPVEPEPLDVDAITAAVLAALPQAPEPAPPVDVEAQIAATVQRVLPTAVSDAVRATELRLRAHIDEAVLALAEAVLTQPAGAPDTAPVLAQAPAVQPVHLTPAPAAPVPVPIPAPTPVVPQIPAPVMLEHDADDEHGKRRWFRRGDDD